MALNASAASFLEQNGAGAHVATFEQEGFTTVGHLLEARLGDGDLKELGLSQMMPRKR